MEKELLNVVNGIIYQQYSMRMNQIRDYFERTNITEYVALKFIQKNNIEYGKMYLKDLSDKMDLNITMVSRIVRRLQDKGLIIWKHDGNGDNGTYLLLADAGNQFLLKEEKKLVKHYGKVVNKYGLQNTKQLMEMLQDLHNIVLEELREE